MFPSELGSEPRAEEGWKPVLKILKANNRKIFPPYQHKEALNDPFLTTKYLTLVFSSDAVTRNKEISVTNDWRVVA